MSDAGVALGNMLFAIAWLVGGVWWASKVEGCLSQIFTFVFGGFLIGFIVEVLYVCIIALLR